MNIIIWSGTLLPVKPIKNTKFTAKQNALLREILDGYTDVSDNTALFRKLVTLSYVIEIRTKQGFIYELTEQASLTLEHQIPLKSKLTVNEIQDNFGCGNCQGTGYIAIYAHVAGGICFACNGLGKK